MKMLAILLILLAIPFFWFVVEALTTGTAKGIGFRRTRRIDYRRGYWIIVAINAAVALLAFVGGALLYTSL